LWGGGAFKEKKCKGNRKNEKSGFAGIFVGVVWIDFGGFIEIGCSKEKKMNEAVQGKVLPYGM